MGHRKTSGYRPASCKTSVTFLEARSHSLKRSGHTSPPLSLGQSEKHPILWHHPVLSSFCAVTPHAVTASRAMTQQFSISDIWLLYPLCHLPYVVLNQVTATSHWLNLQNSDTPFVWGLYLGGFALEIHWISVFLFSLSPTPFHSHSNEASLRAVKGRRSSHLRPQHVYVPMHCTVSNVLPFNLRLEALHPVKCIFWGELWSVSFLEQLLLFLIVTSFIIVNIEKERGKEGEMEGEKEGAPWETPKEKERMGKQERMGGRRRG